MSYRLVIHDDAEHTFHYVIELFVHVLGVGYREAFELASRIHEDGEAAVNFFDLGNVREAEERLLSGGRDRSYVRSTTSLAVSVEQVEGAAIKLLSRGRVGPRGYEPLDDRRVAALHKESLDLHGPVPSAVVAAFRRRECGAAAGLLVLILLLGVVLVAMLAAS